MKTADDIRREATRLLSSAQAARSARSSISGWRPIRSRRSTRTRQSTRRSTRPWRARWPGSSIGISTRCCGTETALFASSSRRRSPSSTRTSPPSTASVRRGAGSARHPRRPGAPGRAHARRVFGRACGRGQLGADSTGRLRLERILCRPPPPPPNVPAAPPVANAVHAHQTTRQRFGTHLDPALLQGMPHGDRRRRLRLRAVRRDRRPARPRTAARSTRAATCRVRTSTARSTARRSWRRS